MIYESNEKYIFISYPHDDSAKVLPYIDVLKEHGFRVWYDAGIEAGTEWPEYIEEHIKKATAILVFMTPNTVASRNCRNEINFALDLEKDILIVYLEDTELLKGMRLQLNSTQSLFRKNHQTNETFVQELINARLLQACRKGGETVNTPVEPVRNVNRNTSLVTNVCTIGTNVSDDFWPSGTYSEVINRDEFKLVMFHMNVLKPFGFTGTITNKYEIYNSDNNLIFEDVSTLDVEPDYDRISFGWIIKGEDGSFVQSGDYRFVCSINGSPSFSYKFTVCSNADIESKEDKDTSFFGKLKKLFG